MEVILSVFKFQNDFDEFWPKMVFLLEMLFLINNEEKSFLTEN